jgi:hypothetical protein
MERRNWSLGSDIRMALDEAWLRCRGLAIECRVTPYWIPETRRNILFHDYSELVPNYNTLLEEVQQAINNHEELPLPIYADPADEVRPDVGRNEALDLSLIHI